MQVSGPLTAISYAVTVVPRRSFAILPSLGLGALVIVGAVATVFSVAFVANVVAFAHTGHGIKAVTHNAASARNQGLLALFELAPALIVALLLPPVARRTWTQLGLRAPTAHGWTLVAGGLFAALAYEVIWQLILFRLGIHHRQAGFEHFKFHNAVDAVVGSIVLCLVAPCCEELVYRAFLFNALAAWMRVAPAAVISGSAFALTHGDGILFAPLLVLAITNAYVYRLTGSIYAPIALHAAFNTVATIGLISRGS